MTTDRLLFPSFQLCYHPYRSMAFSRAFLGPSLGPSLAYFFSSTGAVWIRYYRYIDFTSTASTGVSDGCKSAFAMSCLPHVWVGPSRSAVLLSRKDLYNFRLIPPHFFFLRRNFTNSLRIMSKRCLDPERGGTGIKSCPCCKSDKPMLFPVRYHSVEVVIDVHKDTQAGWKYLVPEHAALNYLTT